ncbi:TPA: DNA adenine methylase [Pseudomonas aeruginosa]|uniref:DNA adenine methylase n=1 Tax=Pseudomonas aeruginosa TaxID=287 RepID=UPI00157ABBB0|nr:DNA adenine methylase [Pseudomonas aeruginosa]MDP5424355.1 DNA adenine methylase [Pseudomonas aeruginosa]HBO2483004.1 DNA adenine methylase [Pseudomonas aeruginosa]HBP6616094.1 DNA adenine methylase [Pseudomonas aeruginosa]HCK7376001.1 DNA adenine methylase [Pseudomonas aeruginosa]HDV4084076.1 DNA adenine methylase [Pseudomonas aeruginosa]
MDAQPIILWIGSKRRLADRILPLMPKHSCYVEPFAGSAALFFLRQIPAEVEVLNDINGDLINLYKVVQYHLEEFVRQFEWALSSRQVFKWLQATESAALTDIQRAARFYYLQQSAFGARVDGQSYGISTVHPPTLNVRRIKSILSAAYLRLNNAYIENLDWQECIKRYDCGHAFFYMDPPYWGTRGYGVPFEFNQYEKMARLLKDIEGKAIISINDHPEIRKVFAGYHTEAVDLRHKVGGGNGSGATELLVFSWDTRAEPSGLF